MEWIIEPVRSMPTWVRWICWAGLTFAAAAGLYAFLFGRPVPGGLKPSSATVGNESAPRTPTPPLAAPPAAEPIIKLRDFVIEIYPSISINLPGGGPVSTQEIAVEQEGKGKAELKVVMLFDRAAWVFGRADAFVDDRNNPIDDISTFLESDTFARIVENYHQIWVLGLVSGTGNASEEGGSLLSQDRAIEFSKILIRTHYIKDSDTHVYGLPLGANNDKTKVRDTPEERRQRSVVLIGVRVEKGEVDIKAAIRELLAADKIEGLHSSSYGDVISGNGSRFMVISMEN